MKKYVICTDNTGMEASLEVRKIYLVIPDKKAEKLGMLRVIDNSEEDYLHSQKRFVYVTFDKSIQKELQFS
ncbi:MAG: hypothetical protein SFU98_21650 [Leptospiraceae bacterium]|nr:hypothetical protein [Leptospiraceae bacterium]